MSDIKLNLNKSADGLHTAFNISEERNKELLEITKEVCDRELRKDHPHYDTLLETLVSKCATWEEAVYTVWKVGCSFGEFEARMRNPIESLKKALKLS